MYNYFNFKYYLFYFFCLTFSFNVLLILPRIYPTEWYLIEPRILQNTSSSLVYILQNTSSSLVYILQNTSSSLFISYRIMHPA